MMAAGARDMLSTSIEDYIKAIYALELEHETAGTKRIAQRLGVKMASVTGMIKHLAAEGYARHTPYRGVRLTDRGRRIALDLIRRHRLIELFLARTLGLKWDQVHADAEVLEHAVSDQLIERIYEYLGFPEFDPHGAPIPGRDGTIAPSRGVTLDSLKQGEGGRIVEVSDHDPEFLRYLTQLELEIGSKIKVADRAPFSGPVTLEAARGRVAISPDACARIRVILDGAGPTRSRRKRN
jgi:DtxR family Mn-dependent transcriptional regulator